MLCLVRQLKKRRQGCLSGTSVHSWWGCLTKGWCRLSTLTPSWTRQWRRQRCRHRRHRHRRRWMRRQLRIGKNVSSQLDSVSHSSIQTDSRKINSWFKKLKSNDRLMTSSFFLTDLRNCFVEEWFQMILGLKSNLTYPEAIESVRMLWLDLLSLQGRAWF